MFQVGSVHPKGLVLSRWEVRNPRGTKPHLLWSFTEEIHINILTWGCSVQLKGPVVRYARGRALI